MDRKKLIIIAVVALGVVLLLLVIVSILNGNNDPSTGDNNNDDNNTVTQPVVLEYWGLWEPESVMQPLIEKYQSSNKHVTIKYTQKSFTQYEENLITRLEQGGTEGTPAPDIFRINNTWLSRFQPHLAPLPSSLMGASDYSQAFYPTAVEDFSGTDGQLYAIPLEIDGLALFYNKELLDTEGIDEIPTDWYTLTDLAIQLTKKDATGKIDQAGLAMGSATNVVHSADILSLLLLQNGVEIEQNFNTEVDIDSDRAVVALQFYVDYVDAHETWSPDLRSDLEMFYSGKLALMLAPSWRAFDILNSNPNIEFGIAPTPILGDEELYYSMYWGEAVSKSSKNPLEAWKFVKFLSEPEQLKQLYSNSSQVRAFGEPYSRVSLKGELANDPYTGAFMQMAPFMQSWKMGDQTFVESELRDAITSVTVNGLDAQTALTAAEKAINERLLEVVDSGTTE